MKKCQNVSVVVPTLNEASCIALLLRRLQTMPYIVEIIVCDGGSRDDTREIAARFGIRVLDCAPNRGAQMNAGANIACGDVLWFLHADALPPRSGALRMIAACDVAACDRHRIASIRHRVLDVRTAPVIGGNFRLRFDVSGFDPSGFDSQYVAARVFALIARSLRSFGVYYGDSGIWMRREAFAEIGGFENWPLFEDYEMARRLENVARRNACRTICIAPPVVVSSRRFGSSTRSAAKLLLRWAKLQVLFWLGFAPETLAKMYRR